MLALLTLLQAAPATQMTETLLPPRPRIESVALFKNGLSWVRTAATVPATQPLVVGEVPDAVHGTFWIESDVPVVARTTEVTARVPFDGRWEHDPQTALAGALVELRLEGRELPLTGRVAAPPERDMHAWDRDYATPPPFMPFHRAGNGDDGPASFLCLEKEGQNGAVLEYVRLADVRSLLLLEQPKPRVEKRLGLELSAPAVDGDVRTRVSYLTKGLAYAPSYRLDLRAGGEVAVTQAAVLRNEFAPLENVEVQIVTGYPNMPLSDVLSPLVPGQSWSAFFQGLGRGNGRQEGAQMMFQNRAASFDASSGAEPPAADEGVDLDYRSLGRVTLAEGEALQIEVASATAPYERIVEWTIPDARDDWGRPRNRGGDDDEDEPWDALRFDNPLGFAMTTAPATIVDGGRFLGEKTVDWAAPGAEVVVQVTKALALGTNVAEYEVESARQGVERWGNTYRRSVVQGEVGLVNRRGEAVTVVVKRRFSGELESAEGEPASRLLGEGAWAVNARRELVWTVTLQPGEERTLEYRYGVLVRV